LFIKVFIYLFDFLLIYWSGWHFYALVHSDLEVTNSHCSGDGFLVFWGMLDIIPTQIVFVFVNCIIQETVQGYG